MPLSKLYSPLLKIDDTFILQEYFVPFKSFSNFVAGLSEVVLEKINKEQMLALLNVTIRYVKKDVDSALPYSTHDGGVFAFVLYFRIRRTKEADELLAKYHKQLADLAINEGGTFYLPYRHSYTAKQLEKAYPSFQQFCKKKKEYDPMNLFGNLWWDQYCPPNLKTEKPSVNNVEHASDLLAENQPTSVADVKKDFKIPKVSTHRSDSFRKLINNPELRQQFFDGFLVDIFSIMPKQEVHRLMVTAAWDARNTTDDEIYASLFEHISSAPSSPFSQLRKMWLGVNQVADQKKELVREIMSILAQLGRVGLIQDYCSIGDYGKVVLRLREHLHMNGKMFIVHDEDAPKENMGAVLERGALDGHEVGEFVKIDYSNIRSGGGVFAKIPDCSCDLVA